MSRVRSKHSAAELTVRSALHARGFRFRLHRADLPGKPDVVLPRYRAVVMVHGCFWHGHDCRLFRLPSTRTEFWAKKIAGNRSRDAAALAHLNKLGWRSATVWECALRGSGRFAADDLGSVLSDFLLGSAPVEEIAGSGAGPHLPQALGAIVAQRDTEI